MAKCTLKSTRHQVARSVIKVTYAHKASLYQLDEASNVTRSLCENGFQFSIMKHCAHTLLHWQNRFQFWIIIWGLVTKGFICIDIHGVSPSMSRGLYFEYTVFSLQTCYYTKQNAQAYLVASEAGFFLKVRVPVCWWAWYQSQHTGTLTWNTAIFILSATLAVYDKSFCLLNF